MPERPFKDPTPAQHAQRHAMEAIARHAELLAEQPPMPPNSDPDAKAYRQAYVQRMRDVAEWAWGRARQ
ncbi:MAG TPA: hypothetical protein VGN96_11225 [Roseococcus sp.]|jgi:hypothetical protein|nr:hypothetical protein [Roseococcus sp.]